MAKRKSKKRTHARRKSGTVASFGRKPKKRGARRKNGFGSGFESWKGALVASAAMRFISGGVAYMAKSQNMGQELPKVKMIAPLLIAYLAKNNIIPMPGLFPAAVQAFVDAAIDNTKVLKDIADFKFMESKPATGKPDGRAISEVSGIFWQQPKMLTARNGMVNSLQDKFEERGAVFRH